MSRIGLLTMLFTWGIVISITARLFVRVLRTPPPAGEDEE